jgi:uncharacterized radical SAM protein YgiQ
MKQGEALTDIRNLRGTAYISRDMPSITLSDKEESRILEIPSLEDVTADKKKFSEAFRLTSLEQNPYCAGTIVQRHGDRMLVCNPPSLPLTEPEMDAVYSLPFEKAPHPSYKASIPAWEQIKTSITSHRGCFGGCSFCAISMHQGRTVQSRSENSVLKEVEALANKSWFRGSVSDIGGPTANMYGLSCNNPEAERACRKQSCIFPQVCKNLKTDDKRAVSLLRKARSCGGVKHAAVSSGVRYDLMERQPEYFRELIVHHISGLLKVAPEHLAGHITELMRKPDRKSFEKFLAQFRDENDRLGKRQQVVPYIISGHPGCTLDDMLELALSLKKLGLAVEQVQDFTPTPGTLSTCMFYTGINPGNGKEVYVPRSDREKGLQKALLLWHQPDERKKVMEALREMGREEMAGELFAGGGREWGPVRKPAAPAHEKPRTPSYVKLRSRTKQR